MIIAIDGPSGAGKGKVADMLAEKLNYIRLDTGATYRCVALKTIENKIDISEEEKIINIAKNINIDILEDKIYLNNKDVTKKIREYDVTKIVSPISSIVEVRKILVNWQRNFVKGKNVVVDGRDTTTYVFPNANIKIYLDAEINLRAKRRYEEYKKNNQNISLNEIIDNIKNRDYNDMHKKVGSLKRAKDAIYIDSTHMNALEVVNEILKYIK